MTVSSMKSSPGDSGKLKVFFVTYCTIITSKTDWKIKDLLHLTANYMSLDPEWYIYVKLQLFVTG